MRLHSKMLLRGPLSISVLLFLAVSVSAQNPKPGEFQSSVTVMEDSTHSYALYLPGSYTPQKHWPILLAFDPSGLGSRPVKLFQNAAEKYGVIVVGSNNTRNFADPSTAIRLLWGDVTKRFAIDPRRIYTTGHSGGARIASSVAIACKTCIAAVIANCAGLPNNAKSLPESSEWFLITGTTDFNYPEMLQLHDNLDGHKHVNRFEVFNGRHGWMPPEMAEEALAWLQLRAMVKGIIPVDKTFVEGELKSRTAHAQDLKKQGDVLAAWREEQDILRDFKTMADTKNVAQAAEQLAASPELRRAIKNEKADIELQSRVEGSLSGAVGAVRDSNGDRQAFIQLESAAENALSDSHSGSDTERRNAIDRAIWSSYAYAVESGQDAALSKNYPVAKNMYRAASLIRPETSGPHVMIAGIYAATGDKKHAIEEMRKAVDKGLNNPDAFSDRDFDHLRDDPAFKDLVARVHAKAQDKQP